jgi:hypothetical protein
MNATPKPRGRPRYPDAERRLSVTLRVLPRYIAKLNAIGRRAAAVQLMAWLDQQSPDTPATEKEQ